MLAAGHMLVAAKQRICLHDHAFSAAVWRVIHAVVLVQSKIADICRLNADETRLLGAADDARLHHRVNHFRKQR